MTSALLLCHFAARLACCLIFKAIGSSFDARLSAFYLSTATVGLLLVCAPFYSALFWSGYQEASLAVWLLVCLKAAALGYAFFEAQKLRAKSLSASILVDPIGLPFIAIANAIGGERLLPFQWVSVLGLTVFGVLCATHGNIKDLPKGGGRGVLNLLVLTVCLAHIDYEVLAQTNWYFYLLTSNLCMMGLSYVFSRQALVAQLERPAKGLLFPCIASLSFAVSELSKFSLMDTTISVSIMSAIGVVFMPIMLAIGALVWHERTWREQLAWGLAAAVLMIPLVLW